MSGPEATQLFCDNCCGIENDCNFCCGSGPGEEAIPDSLCVTLAGLSGDFAQFNGVTELTWVDGCIWTSTGDVITVPRIDLQLTLVDVDVEAWRVRIFASVPGCNKRWEGAERDEGSPELCAPENETFTEDFCDDGNCTDTDSCEDSAGATCDISLLPCE